MSAAPIARSSAYLLDGCIFAILPARRKWPRLISRPAWLFAAGAATVLAARHASSVLLDCKTWGEAASLRGRARSWSLASVPGAVLAPEHGGLTKWARPYHCATAESSTRVFLTAGIWPWGFAGSATQRRNALERRGRNRAHRRAPPGAAKVEYRLCARSRRRAPRLVGIGISKPTKLFPLPLGRGAARALPTSAIGASRSANWARAQFSRKT